MQRTVLGGSSSASPRKSLTKVFTVCLAMKFVTPVQIYHKIYQIYLQWERGDG